MKGRKELFARGLTALALTFGSALGARGYTLAGEVGAATQSRCLDNAQVVDVLRRDLRRIQGPSRASNSLMDSLRFAGSSFDVVRDDALCARARTAYLTLLHGQDTIRLRQASEAFPSVVLIRLRANLYWVAAAEFDNWQLYRRVLVDSSWQLEPPDRDGRLLARPSITRMWSATGAVTSNSTDPAQMIGAVAKFRADSVRDGLKFAFCNAAYFVNDSAQLTRALTVPPVTSEWFDRNRPCNGVYEWPASKPRLHIDSLRVGEVESRMHLVVRRGSLLHRETFTLRRSAVTGRWTVATFRAGSVLIVD